MSSLVTDIVAMYEGCVTEPDRWGDQAFSDWIDSLATNHDLDRERAKGVRRCLRIGRKLVGFWQGRTPVEVPKEWRSRVDVAEGARAWRPVLEVALVDLEVGGDEETFDQVAELFPVVNNQPFLDGIDYDEWRDSRELT